MKWGDGVRRGPWTAREILGLLVVMAVPWVVAGAWLIARR